MSDYGFEIQNIYGQVIADTNYPVYSVHSSGTISFPGYVAFQQTVIPLSIDLSNFPTLLVELPADGTLIAFRGFRTSGTTVTAAIFHAISSAAFSINYILAVPANIAPIQAGEYGIAAYDISGKLTFHTGQRYVIIRQISSVSMNSVVSHPTLTGTRYVGISGAIGAKQTGIYFTLNEYGQQVWYAGKDYLAGIGSASPTSIKVGWSLFCDNTVSIDSFEVFPASNILICELTS
jgi:hypothetical protein